MRDTVAVAMRPRAALFDENASWHTPGKGFIAGDRAGQDAVFAHFGRYGGETGGTFKAELRHVLSDDEGHVVGVHHNSGVRRGVLGVGPRSGAVRRAQ